MKEMDDMLTRIFQDKPISQESLWSLRDGVMNQILTSPMDFQEKLLIAQRRRWGFILLSILGTLGFGFIVLTWLASPWLKEVLSSFVSWIVMIIPSLGILVGGWTWLVEKWLLLAHLVTGLSYIWQQYAFSLMGIILVWVVFEGMREKLLIKD